MNNKNVETTTTASEEVFVEPRLEYVQPSLAKLGNVQEVTQQVDPSIFSTGGGS